MSYKQIAKKIKAAGLQKLKYYCEMCEKQCRDENGFQNHLRSETHARQMALFLENPLTVIEEKSKEFEKAFLDVLRRHGTIRHNANQLYQEIVADRQHVRLNATKWTTFSDFIQYLGQTGIAEIDYVEGIGWYIQYTFKDANAIEREKKAAAYKKLLEETELMSKQALERQLAAAQLEYQNDPNREEKAKVLQATNIDESKRQQKLRITLQGTVGSTKPKFSFDDNEDDEDMKQEYMSSDNAIQKEDFILHSSKRTSSQLYVDQTQESPTSNKHSRSTYNQPQEFTCESFPWVHPELVVRIINKTLYAGEYLGKKAEITKLFSTSYNPTTQTTKKEEITETNSETLMAKCRQVEVKIYKAGNYTKLVVNLEDIEPILPSTGSEVAILRGPYSFKSLQLTRGILLQDKYTNPEDMLDVELRDKRFEKDRKKVVKCKVADLCRTVYS